MTRKRQKARRHHGVGMDFHLGSVTNVVPDSDPSLPLPLSKGFDEPKKGESL